MKMEIGKGAGEAVAFVVRRGVGRGSGVGGRDEGVGPMWGPGLGAGDGRGIAVRRGTVGRVRTGARRPDGRRKRRMDSIRGLVMTVLPELLVLWRQQWREWRRPGVARHWVHRGMRQSRMIGMVALSRMRWQLALLLMVMIEVWGMKAVGL